MKDYTKQTIIQAKEAGACDRLKGDETTSQLLDLFKTRAGLEFTVERHVPTLATIRLFKEENLADRGIYLDAGEIELTNPDNAVIIGKTTATIRCNRRRACRVTAMRGAKATIHAEGWAVVFIRAENGSTIIKNANENSAIITL